MQRNPLKRGPITLCTKSEGATASDLRQINVIDTIDVTGGSAICYRARMDGGAIGTLKEFYPYPNNGKKPWLERDLDGQLIFSTPSREKAQFQEQCREFAKTYELLNAEREKNGDLATFIPQFEILYGYTATKKKTHTVYVWCPQPEVRTFEEICTRIRTNPSRDPEKSLLVVAWAMESLVICAIAMRKAGFQQFDINPSNFGFDIRNGEELTDAIKWFDLNTIERINPDNSTIMGTSAYMPADPATYTCLQRDIYSIGCTLFEAVIISDEVAKDGYHYNEDYYCRLPQLVRDSKLITASESNNHPYLREMVTSILEKCLSNDKKDLYTGFEDLLENIKSVVEYAAVGANTKTVKGVKWVVMDSEEAITELENRNSALRIAYLLYEHPIFEALQPDEETIDVLVLGFGKYGQKFVDLCLPNGQIVGKKFSVTVVSKRNSDLVYYLKERPELHNFFSIDSKNVTDSYGDIKFVCKQFGDGKDAVEKNEKIIGEIVEKALNKNVRFDYVFIALGDDQLNKRAAQTCKRICSSKRLDTVVSYARERVSAYTPNGIYAVDVKEEYTEAKIPRYVEIERMAMNLHLAWAGSLSIDFERKKKQYLDPYNHESSVSEVMAIKAKLFGVDPNLVEKFNKGHFVSVASDLKNYLTNPDIRNSLMWIEHRRWVTEKICQGWTRIKDLDECVGGKTKDKQTKRHICILKGRMDAGLTLPMWTDNNHANWDRLHFRTSNLDQLDEISVLLHRMYVREAKKAIKLREVQHPLAAVAGLVQQDRNRLTALREWIACIRQILAGNANSVKLYYSLKNAFVDSVADMKTADRHFINNQIKEFDELFYPILASKQYKDWKHVNSSMIDNLPFILTYTERSCLVVPYKGENTKELFGNIAAATVVNPQKIVYLYYCKNSASVNVLETSMPYLIKYMDRKKLRASIDVILVTDAKLNTLQPSISNLEAIGKSRNIKVSVLECNGNAGALDLTPLVEKIEVMRSEYDLFAVEEREIDIFDSLVNSVDYLFDPTTMSFAVKPNRNCDALLYIEKRPMISVHDMISLNSAFVEESQPEFFADYQSLWDLYSTHKDTWKRTCNMLGDQDVKDSTIGRFNQQPMPGYQIKAYDYILPIECMSAVERILSYLIGNNILQGSSTVDLYTSDSCKVKIKTSEYYKLEFDRLFSHLYYLMLPDALNTVHHTEKKNNIVYTEYMITYNLLEVIDWDMSSAIKSEMKKANLTNFDILFSETIELLKLWSKEGYILNLSYKKNNGTRLPINDRTQPGSINGPISFLYASKQIKQLFTSAGRMLEVYLFHKLHASGLFDDVTSGYKIKWNSKKNNGQSDMNEIDCILTKGYQSAIIECKAQEQLKEDYYNKLSDIGSRLGVNARMVLVTDSSIAGMTSNRDVIDYGKINKDVTTIQISDAIAKDIESLF